MTPTEVFDILTKGDIVGVLAVLLIGGYFGWWVYGRTFKAMELDRNYWRDHALKLADQLEAVTSIMESSKRGRG